MKIKILRTWVLVLTCIPYLSMAAGGGATDDTAAIQAAINATPEKTILDLGRSRISVTPGKPSFDKDLAAFNALSWKNNIAVRYLGPTQENVYYSNNISAPYGSYPGGVPVNESIFSSPYHTGLVVEVKTPASFGGVAQPAHILGAAEGSTTTDATSILFRKDGKSEFVMGMRTEGGPNRLFVMRAISGIYGPNIWVTDVTKKYTSINAEKAVMNYPFEVGAILNISSGAHVRPDMNEFNTQPTLRLERLSTTNFSGHLTIHPTNNYLELANETPIPAGSAWLKLANSGYIYAGTYSGVNSAATMLAIGHNPTTGRSISTYGTINTGGADYAEYERNNGLKIEKGAIIGFRADGTLTLKYSDAVRFGIKSTNPSLVGGDTWGGEGVIGFKPNLADYKAEKEYGDAIKEWEEKFQTADAGVDRIAYSGKVPCNLMNSKPGDYIIATSDANGNIAGVAVYDADFNQYKRAVGRVNRILSDGRAEVAVIVH